MELKLRHVTKEVMENPRKYVGRTLYVYMRDEGKLEKHHLYSIDDEFFGSRWLLDSYEHFIDEFYLNPRLDIFVLDVED